MSKKIIVLCLLPIFLSVSFGCSSNQKNSNNNYPVGGVANLSLDRNWVRLSDKEKSKIDKDLLAIYFKEKLQIYLGIKTANLHTKDAEIDEIEDILDKQLKAEFDSFNKKSVESRSIDDNRAIEYTFDFLRGKTPVRQILYIVLGNKKTLYMNVWGNPKNMVKEKSEISSIVNNMKLNI